MCTVFECTVYALTSANPEHKALPDLHSVPMLRLLLLLLNLEVPPEVRRNRQIICSKHGKVSSQIISSTLLQRLLYCKIIVANDINEQLRK